MRDDLFNRNIAALQPSASMQFMAKAKAMQVADPGVINLTAGEPDFDTPAPIVEEACRQLKAGYTHYVAAQGLPEGAFYAWLRIDKNGMSSTELCDYLLREARVVGVPGDAYGISGEKCLRFSFAEELGQLPEAADRIRVALDKL